MKPSIETVQSLLALKRHESPPEGYVDDFLREFHQRRREEAVRPAGIHRLWEAATGWFEGATAAKWAYGAGLTYAAVLLYLVLAPQPLERQGIELESASFQVIELPASAATPPAQLEQLDLRPTSEGVTGHQEF